jgi:site-specific DNA-methyltransferase (adenine-specific)
MENKKEINDITMYKGDCLEVMDRLIEQGVVVDAIITDPPYGTTACKWDSVIPFDEMWIRLNKLIKPNGAIVLFCSQPFTSALIMSNPKSFRYEWIWEKQYATNFMGAKHAPLKYHENIALFSINKHKYIPQQYKVIEIEDIQKMDKKNLLSFFTNRLYDRFAKVDRRKNVNNIEDRNECHLGKVKHTRKVDDGYRNPKSVIKINGSKNNNAHPTQKPVELMEYLIKTYTNENELVLDFTSGSGTTGVACVNTNRKGIMIEQDDKYFDIGVDRVEKAYNDKRRLDEM